ncbi:hypothetical protein BH23BAC1_BH23BAC1_14060 [soil metagenome]
MVKIRYRGNDLSEPDLADVKSEVSKIKKKVKRMQCIHHESPSTVHLRYVRQNPVLEKYIKACCYEFELSLKHQVMEKMNV